MGMKNHDVVPVELIISIAKLRCVACALFRHTAFLFWFGGDTLCMYMQIGPRAQLC